MPLKLGEVVEEGRRHFLGRLLDRLDVCSTLPRSLDDCSGFLAVGRQARLAFAALDLVVRAAIYTALSCIEIDLDLQIVFRHELANRDFAHDNHRQGRGLYAPNRKHLGPLRVRGTVIQRVGPREIHSDQPVRATAGPRCGRQVIEVSRRAQLPETVADRRRRQG